MENKRRCIICGFDKKVEEHHIIKYNDFGSDKEKNIVYLCLNHHWIADFGDEIDKNILLQKIKTLTNKEGEIDYYKKKYFEKLIRVLIENDLGEYSDEEYNNLFYKKSSNYEFYKKMFLSRNHFFEKERQKIKEKAEILYLIKRLRCLLKDAKD